MFIYSHLNSHSPFVLICVCSWLCVLETECPCSSLHPSPTTALFFLNPAAPLFFFIGWPWVWTLMWESGIALTLTTTSRRPPEINWVVWTLIFPPCTSSLSPTSPRPSTSQQYIEKDGGREEERGEKHEWNGVSWNRYCKMEKDGRGCESEWECAQSKLKLCTQRVCRCQINCKLSG